jgi:hypothetical protein
MKIFYIPELSTNEIELSQDILYTNNAIGINPTDGNLIYINDADELHHYILTLIEYIDIFNYVSNVQYPLSIDLCINYPDKMTSFSYTIDNDGIRSKTSTNKCFPPSINRIIITEYLFNLYTTIYHFNINI